VVGGLNGAAEKRLQGGGGMVGWWGRGVRFGRQGGGGWQRRQKKPGVKDTGASVTVPRGWAWGMRGLANGASAVWGKLPECGFKDKIRVTGLAADAVKSGGGNELVRVT